MYLRLKDVERISGLSRSSIYRLEKIGQFPQRVKLTERCSAWHASEISEWANSRPTAASLKR